MTLLVKPIIFDVTRLIRRGHFVVPTGIDRIERKYAEYVLSLDHRPVYFEAWLPIFGWQSLTRDAVKILINKSNNAWSDGADQGSFLSALWQIFRSKFLVRSSYRGPAVHLTVAHNRPKAMQQWRALSGTDGRKICFFVHDLIPIEYPQFARPRHAKLNTNRIATALHIADGLIVNSHATRTSLENFCADGKPPPILVAPFGITLAVGKTGQKPPFANTLGRPYFLCVGTIEPRKNHILLLNVWRNMSNRLSADQMPCLIIIGRRGWQNAEIIALLGKCNDERLPVKEINDLSDENLAQMLRGACALLMPSLAEGFGLPVAEALNAGCPVIASDIPAHREVGGAAPLYLQPDDAEAWSRAIINFASDASDVREKHKHAAAVWRPYEWDAHFTAVVNFMDAL